MEDPVVDEYQAEEFATEEFAEEGFGVEEYAEDDDYVEAGNEVKLFGKWSFDDVEVRDFSLVVSSDIGYHG